jgi:hypothetical protein
MLAERKKASYLRRYADALFHLHEPAGTQESGKMQIFKPLLTEVSKLRKHFEHFEMFRTVSKTPGKQLNDFGNDLVALAKQHSIKQSVIARALDVDPSVISRKYNS